MLLLCPQSTTQLGREGHSLPYYSCPERLKGRSGQGRGGDSQQLWACDPALPLAKKRAHPGWVPGAAALNKLGQVHLGLGSHINPASSRLSTTRLYGPGPRGPRQGVIPTLCIMAEVPTDRGAAVPASTPLLLSPSQWPGHRPHFSQGAVWALHAFLSVAWGRAGSSAPVPTQGHPPAASPMWVAAASAPASRDEFLGAQQDSWLGPALWHTEKRPRSFPGRQDPCCPPQRA